MSPRSENTAETERVERIYGELAERYDRAIGVAERLLFAGGREWACSRAAGDVLEIAVGTGRNLAHYPGDARVVGVELSPRMIEIARRRAEEANVEADLRLGDAQNLDFPDERFDAVVCTLALCTIPDDERAVAEVFRALRPGGRFFLLEHVRSPNPVVRVAQRILEPVTLRFEADHLLREPLDRLGPAGFEVEEVHRSKLGIVERISARKPAA